MADNDLMLAARAILGEDTQATARQIRNNIQFTAGINPDQEAEHQQLARVVGLPVDTVRADPDAVRMEAWQKQLDAMKLATESPATAKFMTSLDNTRVVADDIRGMTEVEAAVKLLSENILRAPTGPAPSVSSILTGMAKSLPQGMELTRQGMRMQFADANGLDEMGIDSMRKYIAAQSDVADSTPAFESQTASGLYSGLTSLMRMLPGTVASILTRNPAPVLAAAGLATENESYGKYRARGASGGEAILGATIDSATEVVTELMPMSFLVQSLGKVGAGKFLAGFAGRELAGEEVATIVQDAVDTAIANPEKTWGDYLAERPGAAYQTMLATLVQSGAMTGFHVGMQQFVQRSDQADAAVQANTALQALSAVATAGKLRERDPEGFHQFVDSMAPDASVFIDGRALVNALAQSGVPIEEIHKAMPDVGKQITEAIDTEGDVEISIADYATHIAGTDADQAIMAELKAEPGGMTYKQAGEFYQNQADEMQAKAEEIAAAAETTNAFRESAQSVEREIGAQLQATQRFTPDANASYAKLASSFYTVQAQRLGVTPEELYVQHPLNIQAESLVNTQLFDQAQIQLYPQKQDDGTWRMASNINFNPISPAFKSEVEAVKWADENYYRTAAVDIQAPEFQSWFGSSQVQDDNGAPIRMYHITARDFSTFQPGGTERWTNGKLDPNGSPASGEAIWFSPSAESQPAFHSVGSSKQQFRDGTNVMPVYLKIQHPLLLDDSTMISWARESYANGDGSFPMLLDKTWIKQLKADGYDGIIYKPEGKPKGQHEYVVFDAAQVKSAISNRGTFSSTDPNILHQQALGRHVDVASEEFKAWYSGSNLVDDKGQPMVLYHGTNKAFEKFIASKTGMTGAGVYLGDSPDVANNYADGTGANVVPVYARGKFIGLTAWSKMVQEHGTWTKAREAAEAQGIAGIWDQKFENAVNVFNPENIISAISAPVQTDQFYQSENPDLAAGAEYNGADYNALPAEVKAIVDAQISKLTNAAAVRAKLTELSGTPWARQAIAGALARQGIEDLLAGKTPDFWSVWGAPSAKDVREMILKKGDAAIWARLTSAFIGQPEKPGLAVNGSFLDCEPSKLCATFCYAATGINFPLNVIKAELVAWAIRTDPARAAAMVAREYKAMPDYQVDRALRMFDKGDGNPAWLPFLNALKAEGIRTHVFSKRPDFLRQVDPFHLRLLSIDASNMDLSDKNPDLPVAFVYSGTDKEAAWIKKHGTVANDGRVQLVLPVIIYEKFVTQDALAMLPAEVKPYICPVDSGAVAIHPVIDVRDTKGNIIRRIPITKKVPEDAALAKAQAVADKMKGEISRPVQDSWTCVRCDKGGGVGCYHGQTTASIMKTLSQPLTDANLDQILRELNDVATNLPESARASLISELRSVVAAARAGNDPATEAGNAGQLPSTTGRKAKSGSGAAGNAGSAAAKSAGKSATAAKPTKPGGKYKQDTGNRGAYDPASSTVTLLKDADLSTFLHEIGHHFLEMMADLASQPGAPIEIRQDFEKTLGWFGIDSPDTWHALSFEEKRAYHEQWARGFEAYLLEGNSPSVELSSLFSRFRSWLMTVYRQIKSLKVELSDEVRGVFDRMLASQDAITQAEQIRGYDPLFKTAEEYGVGTEAWAAYQALGKKATDDAIDQLQARSLRNMQWLSNAKNRKIKELQKQAAQLRREVRWEVAKEVWSKPVYQAWQFLTNKENLEKVEAAKKQKALTGVDVEIDTMLTAMAKLGGLNKAQAVSEWGMDPATSSDSGLFGKPTFRAENKGLTLERMAEALGEHGYLTQDADGKVDLREFEDKLFSALSGAPEYSNQANYDLLNAEAPDLDLSMRNGGRLDTDTVRAIPGGQVVEKLRMTRKDGLSPDLVAEKFGLGSGSELVQQLAAVEKPRDAIERITDERMLQRHGELTDQASVERAAEAAIHNEARAEFIAMELKALTKATGPARMMAKAAKASAEKAVAEKKVRELKAWKYNAAEGAAALSAAKAMGAGNLIQAAVEKRAQLLNNHLAGATERAAEEVRRGVDYLNKFDKEGVRKSVDPDYLEQIDTLLDRFDLRKGQSLKAIDKRKSLALWLEGQREQGMEPDIPEKLQNEALRQHYKDMTVSDFRGLVDTVKQIEHLGRLKHMLLTAKDQRIYEAARDHIVGSIEANAQGRTANTRTPTTNMGRALQGLRNFWASHRKAAMLARMMDGEKDGGPMWEYFVRPANERGDMETTMRSAATEHLTTLLEPVTSLGKMGGAGIFYPAINRSLNREARIAIALNTGNAGNLQRLLGGEGWVIEQLKPVLDSLTAAEWKTVQGIWDFLETYRPLIAAKELRVYGKEPEWVDPLPTKVKTADGQVLELRGGYYPIKYDPQASQRAEEHYDAEAAKREMQGAYTSATTRRSFTKSRTEEILGRPLLYTLSGLYSGVNDVIHDLSWHEWLIDTNKLMRSQSIDQAIRSHYGPEAKQQFKAWIKDIAEGERGAAYAGEAALSRLRQGVSAAGLGFNAVSALMQPIGITQSLARVGAKWIGKGIADYVAHPIDATRMTNEKSAFMANRSRTRFRELNELRNQVQDETPARAALNAGLYFLMARFQQAVDVPTWIGAYEKAAADPANIQPDGSMNEDRLVILADQAVIDSQGGGMLKDLSAIERGGPAMKLFTVFYSFMNTQVNLLANSMESPQSKGAKAADLVMVAMVPPILALMLKMVLTPGGGDDEWDLKKLSKRMLAAEVDNLFGLMVVAREFGEAAKTVTGANDLGRDYQGPAGLRLVADTVTVAKEAHQGKFDDGFRKAAINLVGDIFALPSAQINRTITGVKALSEGKTQNPMAVVFGYRKP